MGANEWTDQEIMDQIQKSASTEKTKVKASTTNSISNLAKRRNLIVVGCGDAGSMIASDIKKSIPETVGICYNTSPRGMDKIVADVTMVPDAQDGSGKARDYSKEVFRDGSYKHLLGHIQTVLDSRDDISYIVVTTSTDGGTGSGVSPMVAKIITDNVDVPVIICGVYPALSEDAMAQFNTLTWQSEVEKIGVPYMIFDNNMPGMPKPMIHKLINSDIVEQLKVITGDIYGNSNISMIDSRDMYMLLAHTGGRIVIAENTERPVTGQTLDDYISASMLSDNPCPPPSNVRGIGIFLKGPANLVTNLDTSLTKIRATYGDAAIQYHHIEESDEIHIAIIMSGCSEPETRLYEIKSRYDDIMCAQREKESKLSELMGGMVSPLGQVTRKKKETTEPDLSALDI